jgi:streptogramin lyase
LAFGGVVEYSVPNPSPSGSTCSGCGTASLSGIAAGPDGNVWYFDFGRKLVGRVTPAGSITQFAAPGTGSGSEAIVGAPDGNIWMVARGEINGPDWILKVSSAGVVTKYPLTDGVGPEGITWGPDGNIWFTEFWSGRVGRMTPAGVVTEFSLPTPNPRGIVTGPDHNLWIAEGGLQHESIARMTIKGEVTEFPLGSDVNHQLQPYNIVAGPDGNMWFTEIGHIGRITPTGVITQFPMGSGHDNVFGLAGGVDGNVWFVDATANTVGRITPTGDIRQYPLPRRNAGPAAIAAGPDGRLWFTESNVSLIASIGYKVPEATFSSRVLTFAAGSPAAHEVTVTNTGDAPLVIAGIKLVGSDQASFTVTHDGCAGQRVAVKGSCRIDVAFKPGSDSGVLAARLAITDNATASPQSVSLMAQLPDCKLPVFTSPTDPAAQGGFLSLRDGAVTLDPKGGFVPGGLLSHSQASPVLYGQVPATYDPAADRWVPGGRISPDGSRYAYVEFSSQGFDFHLHVVDVATGRDRKLNLPTDNWSLLAFTTTGLYVSKSYPEVGNGPGLWLVNPDSGAIQTIFTDAVVQVVSGHMAWIVARNNADTLPGPPGIGGSNNEIQGRDLNTLQTTTWLYRPGSNMYVGGATGGSIIVSGFDVMSSFLLALTGPEQAVPINVPETGDAVPLSQGLIADANGWWLGSLDGIYLWTPHTGAVLVSESLASPAGACA